MNSQMITDGLVIGNVCSLYVIILFQLTA